MTGKLVELILIMELAQDRLNKEIKINYQRDTYEPHGQWRSRVKPVTQEQKAIAKKYVEISWEKDTHIHGQVQDRLWMEIRVDGSTRDSFPYKSSERGGNTRKQRMPNYIDKLIDLLERTQVKAKEILRYNLITE
jgi:hypothetical protein